MKKILLVLFTLISLSAFAQTNGDIVDRLNAKLGVRLPAEFEAKVKEFAANDTIMRTRSATAFTEQFIIEQFKNDWGIDRQNQLLYMWSSIYGGITKKFLYDFLEDDNEARSDEYCSQLKNINQFYEGYKKGFKEYMEQKSAEYDRRSAEAQQRSAEAQQRSAEAQQRSAEAQQRSAEAITNSLKNFVWFFNRYHMKDKEAIPPDETQAWKNKAMEVFIRCKVINLNYKAILRKELGDDKKVQELLKFYGVE
jgi:hypothetical protein